MKKNIRRILYLLLAVLLCFTGCGENPTEPTGEDKPNDEPQIEVVTDEYIVKDGKSDYKIVIPDGAEQSDNETFAAEELRELLFESTKVKLEIISDKGLTHTEDGKYISIGVTELFKTSGIEKDESLTYNGYQLITKGKSVYCIGKSTNGTINAVYAFLESAIHFDCFNPTVYIVDKNVKELPLFNFNEKRQPDVAYAESGTMLAASDKKYRQRMHFNLKDEIYLYPSSRPTWIHNTFDYFPLAEYQETHPKWYGANNQQLCYCANGDAEELELMKQVLLEKCKELILEKPMNKVIGFTHQDIDIWCSCDKCKESKKTYGTDSAVVIKFLNDVAGRLREWVKTVDEIKNNTYEIMFFAYNPTVTPPAKKDSDGVYKPIDSSVKMDPWVSVMIAPILSDFYVAYDESPNEAYMAGLEGWGACSDNLYLWTYNYSYTAILLPFSLHNSESLTKKLYLERGLKGVFEEEIMGIRATRFNELGIYLNSKLNWDLNADVRKLVKKYFDAVYGDASKSMMEFYDAVRMALEQKYRDNVISGDCWSGHRLNTGDAWSYSELKYYSAKVEQAIKDLDNVKKTDPEMYEIYKNNVMLEGLFPRYALIEFYGEMFTNDVLTEMKKSFRADATVLGVDTYDRGGSIEDLYETWGI